MVSKPKKRNILTDSIEIVGNQIKDLGEKTISESAKAATLSFVNDLYSSTENSSQSKGNEPGLENQQAAQINQSEKMKSSEKDKKKNSTPLDIDDLRKKHNKTDEDKVALNAIRDRLFNRVKEEEQSAQKYFKDKEQSEKSEEMKEIEEKKQAKQRASQQSSDMPQGKVQRGGLFGKKKRVKQAVAEQQPEMRGSGKH